jgi:hypothetical protein
MRFVRRDHTLSPSDKLIALSIDLAQAGVFPCELAIRIPYRRRLHARPAQALVRFRIVKNQGADLGILDARRDARHRR